MRKTTKLPVVKIKVFPGGHMPEKKTKGAAASGVRESGDE